MKSFTLDWHLHVGKRSKYTWKCLILRRQEDSTLGWTSKNKTLCTNTRTKDQLFGLTVYCYQPIARFLYLEHRKFLFCVYFLFRCHQRAARLVDRTRAQLISSNILVANTEVWIRHHLLRIFWSIFPRERASSRVLSRKNVPIQKQLVFDSNDATKDDELVLYRLVLLENSTGLLQNVFPWTFVQGYVEEKRDNTIFQRWPATITTAGFRIHLDKLGQMIHMKWNASSTGMGWQGDFLAVAWFPYTVKPQWKVCWSIKYNAE